MQVMEPGAQPEPLQVPWAEIVGLQFGLATSKEFHGFSVIKNRSKDSLNSLVDPRLGLPAENEMCATCGGTNYDECPGHFAHVKLTQPIFHPNHIRLLQRILQSICLACGVPKEKKKKTTFVEGNNWKKTSLYFEPEDVNGDGEAPVVVEAEPVEKGAGVIELSSEDEIPPDILQVIPHGAIDFTIGSTSQSSIKHLPPLGSSKSKGKAHANGSSHVEATENGPKKSTVASKKSANMKSQPTQSHVKGSKKIYKGRPAGLDVLNTNNLRSKTCRHCSSGNPDYRPILVKILPVKGRRIGDSSEILQLEVQENEDDEWLPDDFWAFLGGPARPHDSEYKVPTKYVLSPSEAYTILKKIPDRAIGKLGMHRLVARPEGLIMKCVPIPPNCTRTTDYKYVNNTTAVQFGSDNVTRTLQNLVTEIGRIHRTRTGKAMSRAQREESTALQILTAEYLREKGAPKAVAGKEPQKRDRNGRITKQDDHRWTKDWLSNNLLGKGGNFTAKAVIVGDPSLGIEEIGIPWAISQKLTIPERATKWNCARLQEYVDAKLQEFSVLKELSPQRGKPGATRIERGGQAFQVMLGSTHTHKVQIGDVVHRNIQNRDYVYVNRPPSVHKHSLMALKVHVHYGLVITVNPLVCPPFNADFDGDIFHVFVPQSLQAIAELKQLMSVPKQIVSDHGGQPLLGLTQDTLLAAHLLTTSKLFVDKASMHQLCLWSSKQPPEAAILKSPKGGPFWTGEQVFGLTLPAKLNMGSSNESILIQEGQILKWVNGTKLLRKEKESIASALCLQLGPEGLVGYLNDAAGLLHAWLQVQGFSTGLTDFQVTNNPAARQKMLQSIFEEYYWKSIQESCDSVRILDAKVQAMGPESIDNPDNLTKNIRFLEQAAQQIFRGRESDAENILVRYAEKNNSLLLMVKSGSKGSRGKLLQQIAGMGLQLYKGKHLLPFSSTRRSSTSNSAVLDWWEDKGLVRSSFVDGLSAPGLFNHVTADRTGLLRKHVEVAQPGTLFKSLMLFLRDLHVVYDGSVRSQCGNNLVQFCYGGAVGVARRTGSRNGSIRNHLGMDYPITPMEEAQGDLTWEEDDCRRWPFSVLAGEPVGVLAATAISQPAYELMLDAPSLNGPFMPRPLELVQDTLYPREKTDLKPSDRCVIIRLIDCQCTKPLCLERRVLDVQAFLTRITLKTLAQSTAIQFWNMEDFRLAGSNGEALRLGSPWLGHIKLSLDMMKHHQVDVEDILLRLREKFSDSVKNAKKQPMGQIFFCSSRNCSVSDGLCLHFSPILPRKMQNQKDNAIYNAALLTLLMKIRRTIIPGLLDCTVKGDERLESVRIVREDPSWTIWHNKLHRDLGEELVLEIVVAPTKSKLKRSMPWTSVKEACLPFMDMVDWNRSMPYSIQEIRHTMGIETAYQMVTRRLGLVLEKTAPHTHPLHVKLVADMMTFSGDANGFSIWGFQDMNKKTAVSAPFVEASFKKPIRTLLDAAGRGATDSLKGVMTSCVWGKEAPLGTGSSFDIFWQPSKDMQRVATSINAEKDVHAIWKDLDEKCIPDKVIPSSPTHSLPGLDILPEQDLDMDEGAGFSPQHSPNCNDADGTWNNSGDDGDGWGNPQASKEDDGGWGAVGKSNDDDGGWGSVGKAKGDDGGWGAVGKSDEDDGGWGAVGKSNDDDGGWGAVGKSKDDDGGWGAVGKSKDDDGGWGAVDKAKEDDGGWGAVGNAKEDDGGWGTGKKGREDDGGWGGGCKDTQGGWGDDAAKTGTEGGRGDDDGGWGKDGDVSNERTSSRGRNDSDWGASQAVQESGVGGGGWDSISTEVAEGGDGWDSMPGSGAEDNRSQERYFTPREENRERERTWDSGGRRGRGRGRGRRGDDWGSGRDTHVSGANTVALGVRRNKTGWDDAPSTSTKTSTGRDGNWNKSDFDDPNALPQSPEQDPATDSGVDAEDSRPASNEPAADGWDSLPEGNEPAADGWGSLPEGNESAADGWGAVSPKNRSPEHTDHRHGSGAESERTWTSGGRGRGRGSGGRGNDWGSSRRNDWQETEPESKETDEGERTWTSGGRGRGRGRGGRGNDWGSSRRNDWQETERESKETDEGERTWTPGGRGRGRGRGGRGIDWGPSRRNDWQETEPECKEIDDLVKSMRRILSHYKSQIGERLSDKDDEAVQSVLANHPNLSEKTGCGVAYIKVGNSPDYPDVQCFWLVRTDGSETEFSYHKCLKEKVAREFPSFVDRYDDLYTGRGKRAVVAPPADLLEERPLVGPAADLMEEGSDAGQREDAETQPIPESAPTRDDTETQPIDESAPMIDNSS